jgi:hypothetical protein
MGGRDREEEGMEQLASLIVDSPEGLTEEWFTAVLRDGGALPEESSVTFARSELIGTGHVGIVVRSELSYEGPAGSTAPSSVVVKLPTDDPACRQLGITMGLYESEGRFYKEIAPRASIAVPRLYWGDFEPETGRTTLVIEDLTPSAEVGDDTTDECSPERADLAFAQLSELHASLWNDPCLRSLSWLGDPARAQLLFGAVAPSIEPYKEAYRDRLEPEHLALVDRLGPKAAGWPAKALVDPLVVVHGDFRLDNMMFAAAHGAPPVTIIDWQTCRLGPPLLDHTIFLINSMTTEDRRAHERDLLRRYHEGLCARGVRGFSFEDCLESYRRSSLYPFMMAIALSVAVAHTDRGREVAAQTMRGAADLVQDLGAAEFLD